MISTEIIKNTKQNHHLRTQMVILLSVFNDFYGKHKKNKQNQISLFDPNDTKFIQNNNINVSNKIINNKLIFFI